MERLGERPARPERPERLLLLNFLCWLSMAETWAQQEGEAATALTLEAAGLSWRRSAMAAIASMSSKPAAITASDIVSGSLFRKRH